MVTLLYGRAGSGKSTYIMDMIMKDCEMKRQSYLIVPEQENVIAERELAERLPPSAQLYTEALSFTRLSNKVFRLYGGLRYNYVTRSGKSLIMYRALCEVRDSLCEYKMIKGREKNAVNMFLDAIGELKTYGVDSASLSEAANKIGDARLIARVNDLNLVREVYDKILYDKYSDPYDDIFMLKEKLGQHRFFEGARVYLDSFYGFTGGQMAVISEIAKQCDELIIAIDMPYDADRESYARIGKTATAIESMCRRLGIKSRRYAFDKDRKHVNGTITHLCNDLWDFSAPCVDNCDGIHLVRPDDEFDECDYVASCIKRLIMDGCRYSDIAIVMRDEGAYSGIIDYTLDKYRIPYFFSHATDIMERPLIKMVFSALSAVSSYRAEDILAYAKCGYADIDPYGAGELEEYMYRWGINGRRRFDGDEYWASNPDGFVEHPTESQSDTLKRIINIREKIARSLSPLRDAFDKQLPCRDTLRALYDFLEEHRIREKLDCEIASMDREEAIRTSQLYSALIGALDTVHDIMGDSILDAESLITMLRYALSEVSVGSIPTGDDKVTVGEASGIRAKNIRHVFILGVCAGSFPAEIRDDGFFCDADKIALETHDIILSSQNDVRSGDELISFTSAMGLASESIYVLSPKKDIRGSKRDPSMAYLRIKELLPKLEEIHTSAIPAYERIYTMDSAREYAGYTDRITLRAIEELSGDKRIARSFSNEDSSIGEDAAKELYGMDMALSQSRIEDFASCRFNFYCKHILMLKDGGKNTFGSVNIGNLTHKVFELFLKRVKDGGLDLRLITDEEIGEMVDIIIESYLERTGALIRPGKRMEHLFARLRGYLLLYIGNIVRELRQSEFSAEYMELRFNDKDGVAPLKFEIGEDARITLNGVCDRVDIYRKGDITYVRVVDYKSGSKTFSRADISMGIGLQLIIYLFTLCKLKGGELKARLGDDIRPAGFMYLPLSIGRGKEDIEIDLGSSAYSELEKSAIYKSIARNGMFLDDPEILRAQDKELKGDFIPEYSKKSKNVFVKAEEFDTLYSELEDVLTKIGKEMLSGDAAAAPVTEGDRSPCKYCKSKAVCRRRG